MKTVTSKKRNTNDAKEDDVASVKKSRLLTVSVQPQDAIVVPNGKRVTIFCDWRNQRPMTIAARFVNEVRADKGRFIRLEDDRAEILDDEAEEIHWIIEARKHKRAASEPVTDEERTAIVHADIIIVPFDDGVTLYSDWMKQRPDAAASQLIAQVQNDGGKFVLFENSKMKFLKEEREMMRWVTEAKKQAETSSSFFPYYGDESDIKALVMTKDALKDSKSDRKERYVETIGGTAFKPEIDETQIREFIKKGNKLRNRSDVALYKLIRELDDEEDAVHLYRNFHDEDNISSENGNICFSRREVDILAYATLYGIEWGFTWNLMPYRDYKQFYKLYHIDADGSLQKKMNNMLGDPTYKQHLNQCVSPLFEEL